MGEGLVNIVFLVQTQDTFTLTVKGTDMNGASGGLSGTGQVVIKLLDINDNIPKLEKDTVRSSEQTQILLPSAQTSLYEP